MRITIRHCQRFVLPKCLQEYDDCGNFGGKGVSPERRCILYVDIKMTNLLCMSHMFIDFFT